MERLSAKALERRPRAQRQAAGLCPIARTVGAVTHDRVTNMGEMNADLVRAPGVESAFDQARDRRLAVVARITLKHLPVRHRGPAALAHCAPVARMGMAVERRVNRALRTRRGSPNQRQIAALQRSFRLIGELRAEYAMRSIRL